MSEEQMEGPGPGAGADRVAEGSVEVGAPIERVWRALTEAEELERWFPLDAEVEPPPEGGRIWMSWGDEHGAWLTIEAWEPPRHLRTSWQWGDAPAQVTDYWLDSAGDGTRLRVVTSGFPADASWDDLVEGTRLGWRFELHQLKHYLERHAGEPRRAAYIRRRVSLSRRDAWTRLMAEVDLDPVVEDVFDRTPPWQLAAVTRDPSDGLLRLTVDPTHGDPDLRDVTVWVCAWGAARPDVDPAANHWRAELARLFPDGEPLDAEA